MRRYASSANEETQATDDSLELEPTRVVGSAFALSVLSYAVCDDDVTTPPQQQRSRRRSR